MAALTLGFTGMDASTESELRHAFEQALPASGGGWQLVPDTHADYVVVDMDSMYGPMSWLRLHAAGKHVVGLTAAPRTQTPYRLGRPVGKDELATLLRDIRDAAGIPAAAPAPTPAAVPAAAAEPSVPPSRPSGMTPSPEPMDLLPEERPLPSPADELPANPEAITEPAAIADEPPSVAVGQVLPAAPSIEPAPAAPAAPVAPAASAAPAEAPAPVRSVEPRTLAEWLASGRVRGRVRFGDASTSVLIDADERQYFGPAALKATAPLFDRESTLADFEPVSADVWSAQTAALGAPQPLARLIWFGALLAGQGRLEGGYGAGERFKLSKWPQTEREFPKHFRIATAMMKGPATVAEIAEASSVPEADVADFVNASLATGFAEPYREPEPEPDSSKPGGLFGRLRGR
ncbi:hypothetical protein [Cognatilysobacter segetis]|uniref:hypothetical protein n=1 Tax=Cognatilysobacter segetis TaxID=2492394 RepID=UPI00192E34E4|nr:hypothetical protein [Lysobacter segetis]